MRNRPFEGSSGFEVITPFRLDDGTVFMVDRGWIAQASDGRPSEYAAPPTGQVEVDARLKAGEERIAGRTSTGIEFATIDLDELAERVGEPSYTGAYGVLVQIRRRRRRAAARRGPPGARRGPAPLVCAAVVRLRAARVRRARLGREPGAARARGGIRSGARGRHAARAPRRPKREKADADADLEDEVLDRR